MDTRKRSKVKPIQHVGGEISLLDEEHVIVWTGGYKPNVDLYKSYEDGGCGVFKRLGRCQVPPDLHARFLFRDQDHTVLYGHKNNMIYLVKFVFGINRVTYTF